MNDIVRSYCHGAACTIVYSYGKLVDRDTIIRMTDDYFLGTDWSAQECAGTYEYIGFLVAEADLDIKLRTVEI